MAYGPNFIVVQRSNYIYFKYCEVIFNLLKRNLNVREKYINRSKLPFFFKKTTWILSLLISLNL